MNRILLLTGIALCIALLPSDRASAAETNCRSLTVDISGTLPANQDSATASNNHIVLDIPLEQIEADDATLALRFREAAERIWVVDLSSASKAAPEADRQFQESVMHIGFDKQGQQEVDQSMMLAPLSTNENGGEAIVYVRLSNVSLDPSQSTIGISATTVAESACPKMGVLDVNNEVNGGRSRETRYYETDEEGLAAMLRDHP